MRAIVLLSGGLDSYTAAAIAKAEGFGLCALTVRYGQRHAREIDAAHAVARALGVERHLELAVDLRCIGGSSLTSDATVPRDRDLAAADAAIPSTYVPARNTIFLAFALGVAEIGGAREIWIGANAVDYSGYPDCRPAFLEAFERMANLATKAALEGATIAVRAPLVSLSKAEIIRAGVGLGVDYAATWSCYDPQEGRSGMSACGRCDSCRLRKRGFDEAKVPDPTRYAVG
jgi:7-cyano-7-deazaguanine synthase